MKIICVGLNYANHIEEFNSKRPEEPVIFFKPDSAILRDNKPFYIPDFTQQLDYELELVVRINRLGKNIGERFAHRYYDSVALGIDLTARDLQRAARAAGHPWALSKGFDGSAVLSEFIPVSKTQGIDNIHFHLEKNGVVVQRGYSGDMLFKVDQLIAYISKYISLKIGDLIYTGTPAGVGSLTVGDQLKGYIEDEKLIDFQIR